jgi:hypothetical protein
LERPLTWNPRKEIFVSDKEANGRLALRPMRAPWKPGRFQDMKGTADGIQKKR